MLKLPETPRYILCQYRPVPNSIKSDKIPIHNKTFLAYNAHDPSIHMTYTAAKDLANLRGAGYGVGFVLTAEDRYFCIDLDECLDDNNNWLPIVTEVCSKFPTAYMEVSNSGRGIHIIGHYQGTQLIPGCKSPGIEVYTDKRFIALAEINPQGDATEDYSAAIIQFIADKFSTRIQAPLAINDDWSTESHPDCNPPEDNHTLIEFLLNRRPTSQETFGEIVSFRDLWERNVSVLSKAYPPQSEGKEFDSNRADAALIHRLLYFVGGNCQRVLDLMYMSGLYTPDRAEKWGREKYLPDTIRAAPGRYKKCYAHSRAQENINPNSSINQQNSVQLEKENYPELIGRKVLDTSNNLKFFLDVFKITVRWNNMSRVREVQIPGKKLFVEDSENSALRVIEDLALFNNMPIPRMDKNLATVAQENNYHPIVEGLNANPWDGVPRLNDFIDTIESATPELSFKLIRRWMVSAIAAIYTDGGFSCSGVLVLSGDQNIGKTRWIKALDPFNCRAVKSGSLLDPTNKDIVRTLASFWIVELGELDGTFRRTDIARLKSYLTEDFDKIRFPFERKDSELQRRTAFAASVNDPKYLIDDTGNRRFWTIPVISINADHNLDMVQVWAEVYRIWIDGEQTYLTQEEFLKLNAHNKMHEQLDPLEEALHIFFDFTLNWKEKNKLWYSATEVLRHLGYDKPTKSQCTQMGAIIMKATGIKPIRGRNASKHALVLKSQSTTIS